MKLWRWFVGQVARLRRSVVGGFAPDSQPLPEDDHLGVDDERALGPPAHWVERVRNGAPGLLEPSLRRRDGTVEPPSTNRVALSQPELEAEPESLEEPERGYMRTEPTVAPQRPEAPVRARPLRRLLRRTASRPKPARAAVTPETDTNHVPHEVETATRRVSEPPEPPPAEPDRRRFVADNRRTSAPPRHLADEPEHSQGPPVPDKRERSSEPEPERLPEQSEIVLFEAPVQRRVARVEQAASPAPPPETVEEVETDLFWEQADPWPSPAPIRDTERLPQRLVSPQPSPPEASVTPSSPSRRRPERLSEAAIHPWPELPPPLDEPDSDVEAALRAWEHRRRLDFEQTRL